MKSTTVAIVASAWAGAWILQAGAIGSEPSAAERNDDKPAVTTTAEKAAAQTEEFQPPPGFKTKKHGKHTLYCKRDTTIGTRFKTERCYNEAQMRDYMIAQEENKRDIDRVRSTCSNICVCGDPSAC